MTATSHKHNFNVSSCTRKVAISQQKPEDAATSLAGQFCRMLHISASIYSGFLLWLIGRIFMVTSQSSELIEKFSQYHPENMAKIIEFLAGGNDNLKVDVQKLRFSVGKQKFEVNGEVNFNVIHKNPLAHAIPQER